ncbi:STAS domain-containing protein [Singulisphaera sp. PoT]|uniref:STAS domain-containing protein n=1 Tax=Singulisphaera sp. PoT TaxID=3411797 RepID=UPI003BF4E8FE
MSTFKTREEPDGLVISFEDSIGLNDFRSNVLRDTLYETIEFSEQPKVALDLSRIDYLSSSGVAILVGIKRRIDGKQGKLVLYSLQPVVRELLEVMKLDRYFVFADDEASALTTLRPVPTA